MFGLYIIVRETLKPSVRILITAITSREKFLTARFNF